MRINRGERLFVSLEGMPVASITRVNTVVMTSHLDRQEHKQSTRCYMAGGQALHLPIAFLADSAMADVAQGKLLLSFELHINMHAVVAHFVREEPDRNHLGGMHRRDFVVQHQIL
jgi:hypothetical protein